MMNTIRIPLHAFVARPRMNLFVNCVQNIIRIEFGVRSVIFLALTQLIQYQRSLQGPQTSYRLQAFVSKQAEGYLGQRGNRQRR